jgi:hypothetical protein
VLPGGGVSTVQQYLRTGLDPGSRRDTSQLTSIDTRFIVNAASGRGPRDGRMVVANRWSYRRIKRQAALSDGAGVVAASSDRNLHD